MSAAAAKPRDPDYVFGECDCCGQDNRQLFRRTVYGIETTACWECCGMDGPDEDTPRAVTDTIAAFDALIAAHDTASAQRREAIRQCSEEIDRGIKKLAALIAGWR